MAKKNEITVTDVLLKLSYIFKDMYLINSTYCIAGSETDSDAVGKFICILSPEITDIFVDYFGNISVMYFENIKKAKAIFGTGDEYKYIKTQMEESKKKQFYDKKDTLMKVVDSIKDWDTFKLTEEQIADIMDNGQTITLFEDEANIPNVLVSKSIFPLLKSKDFNNIYYGVTKARNLKNMYLPNSFDAVVTNPPYKKINTGLKNEDEKKIISRHEVKANLEDFIEVTKYLLKDKGEFYMVHRPDRLVDIMCLMRKYKIEPKQIKFVCPNVDKAPNLVLIKGVKNGGVFLKMEKNLYVYNKDGSYTDEILEIYNKK